MGSNSEGNVSDTTTLSEIQYEETNHLYKIAMTTFSIGLLLFMIVATVAMRRTKSTPETARFLSSGLLFFDVSGIFCFLLRRFISNRDLNIFMQVLGINSVFLAYVSVGIMSFERFLIFSSPHFYIQRMSSVTVKKVVSATWICVIGVHFYVRYGMCFAMYSDATMDDVVGRCNVFSYAFYYFFFIINCIISGACYVLIFFIERRGYKIGYPKGNIATIRALMRYKTTGIVFLYIVSIYFTTLSYAGILLFLRSNPYASRIGVDITNMASCILDPCLYVLWFRECRYEVLKMFVWVNPWIADRLGEMRMEIFGIVAVDRKKVFKNRVEPLSDSDGKNGESQV